MLSLKLLIPLFIIVGLLQAGAITLPFMYWRLQAHMRPVNKILFGSFLLFIAFVVHPLILTGLITFTIAPTLLSLRRNVFTKAGAAYTALAPQTFLPLAIARDGGLPKSNVEWLCALLGGYAGWKVLGTLPSLVLLGVYVKRGIVGGWKVQEKSLGVRSRRTDVQVFR
ncbi:hypothetical protein EKO04_010051 [Ascochyta lentis]|uniref:Uncharacterized protein n=1 Tax=Ascochyta lentis TaxID=205686 RepID=A0A8H7IWK6_9PLEO|nr:hypothetical protein EKO04_010051 [Ascochyta lentis]